MKKLIACIVILCLGPLALACPAAALDGGKTPIVLVHGLGGWGEGTPMNELFPYWGMLGGDIIAFLKGEGNEAYAASVSPVASAWDRACELYAHLTGTRVDYGEAHSKEHGHARYGQTYEPLGPGWPDGRIHLVGHSFGGATVRLFAQLCAEGSAAERAATPAGELSPLFGGQLGGSIVSVTTLAAPHNGTTALLEPVKGLDVGMIEIMLYAMAAVGDLVPAFGEFYPAHLDQFGEGGDIAAIIEKLVAFNQGGDSAQFDLSVDGAAQVNAGIRCQPGIHYFSYAADMTRRTPSGSHLPKANITLLMLESSLRMGQKRVPYATPGGAAIDDKWLPNDGLVNTISALYPFGEPHRDFDAADIQPGVWQVMPVIKNWDHIDFSGGMRLGGARGIEAFYLELARMLESL